MIESVIYGLINGVLVALLALAIAIHYRVSRYFDFFLPALVALGGYLQYLSVFEFRLPIFLALLVSGLTCLILAILIDVLVLTPLHRVGASRAILLLTSLGGYLVIVAALGAVFGSDTKVPRLGMESTTSLLGARLPIIRIWLVGYGLVVLLALATCLRVTRFGRLLNAAFDSTDLLECCGYDQDSLRRITYAAAGSLSGTCGALFALDTGVEPTGAMTIFLIAATAVTVGGIGRLSGALVAGIALSLARALLIWVVPAQWSETLVYIVLFAFVCLRPRGLFPLRHVESSA